MNNDFDKAAGKSLSLVTWTMANPGKTFALYLLGVIAFVNVISLIVRAIFS